MDFLKLDRAIIKRCREFEQRWEQDKEPPLIEDYLEDGQARSDDPLFEELLACELELRGVVGQVPNPEDYLKRFPGAETTVRKAFAHLAECEIDRMPEQLGDFKIVWRRGHGATSVVYEAIQVSLQRRVALKLLVGNPFLDSSLKRLNNEARTIALLNHPHIVTLHGVGADRGYSYLVMQYVNGCGLDRILKDDAALPTPWLNDLAAIIRDLKHPKREGVIVGIVEKIASALSYAHQNGILHRDVKPSNILLSGNGDVYLSDFGLACLGQPDSDWAEESSFVGTPHYIPPEVFEGDWSAGADVYSLGITLHRLLTGYVPDTKGLAWHFDGNRRTAPLPRPRALNPRLDRDLEAIVLQATRFDRTKRYQSAEEFLLDLRAYKKHEPISARRAHAWRQFELWVRRDPVVSFLAIALFVTLLVGIIHAEFQISRTSRTNRELQTRSRQHYLDSWDQSVRDGLGGTSLLWLMNAIEIQQSLSSEGDRVGPMDACRFANTLNELPLLEKMWLSDTAVDFQPEFVPGKSWVAMAASGGGLVLRDVASGDVVSERMTIPGGVGDIAISPNGKYLAATTGTGRGDVTVFELPSGRLLYTEAIPRSWARRLAFSDDSTLFAVQNHKHIRILDTVDWREIGPPIETQYEDPVEFSIDGESVHQVNHSYSILVENWGRVIRERVLSPISIRRWLLDAAETKFVLATKDGLQIYSSDSEAFLTKPIAHPNWYRYERPTPALNYVHHDTFLHMEVAPGERYVAAGSASGVVVLVDLATGEKVGNDYRHAGEVTDLAFSPSGSHLVSASGDGKVQVLSVPELLPQGPTLTHESFVTGVDVDTDGTRLVTMTELGITRVWNLVPARLDGEVKMRDVTAVSWKDGLDTVALARSNGRIEFWSPDFSDQSEQVLEGGGEISQLLRSDDGKIVASLNEDLRPRVWRLPDAQPMFKSAMADPFDIALSSDGRWLARMHSVNFDLIDLHSGEELISAGLIRWKGTRHPSRKGIIFADDLKRAYFFSFTRTLRSVELSSGEMRESIELLGSGLVSAMATRPDGRAAAIAFDKLGVRFLSLPDLVLMEGGVDCPEVMALEYGPEGNYLAIASPDGAIRVLSVDENSVMQLDHGEGLDGLIFLANGDGSGVPQAPYLVSWDIYGRLRTWDLDSGSPRGPFTRMDSAVHFVTRSPEGGGLLVGNDEGLLETVNRLPIAEQESFVLLESLAHLYAGRRLDIDDNLRPLTPEQLSRCWDLTRKGEEKRIQASLNNVEPWRHRELLRAFARNDWESVFFHADGLLKESVDDVEVLSMRARSAAELGRWKVARADYQRLIGKDSMARISLLGTQLALDEGITFSAETFDTLSFGPCVNEVMRTVGDVTARRMGDAWIHLRSAVDQSEIFDLGVVPDLKFRRQRAGSQDLEAWRSVQFLLKVAMSVYPDQPILRAATGIVLGFRGEWEEAVEVLESVGELGPTERGFVDLVRARAYYEVDELEFVRKIEPSDYAKKSVNYWMMLGNAQVKAREWWLAADAFNRAIRLAGTNTSLRRHRREAGRASLRWPIGYGGHNAETVAEIQAAIDSLLE